MTDNRYCKHMNWNHYKKDTCDKQEDQYYCEVEKKCKHDHKGKSCCRKHEDWKHNYCACEKKSCWKDDRDGDKDDHHHCVGCICHLLRRFELGTTVDLYLSSGGSFLGVIFLKLDTCNCCAYFVEAGAANAPIIVDCKKIDALRRIATV